MNIIYITEKPSFNESGRRYNHTCRGYHYDNSYFNKATSDIFRFQNVPGCMIGVRSLQIAYSQQYPNKK